MTVRAADVPAADLPAFLALAVVGLAAVGLAAGMVSAIAPFGLAWLTDTFIHAHQPRIVAEVGSWVDEAKFIFFLAVFLVCALTTSQSAARLGGALSWAVRTTLRTPGGRAGGGPSRPRGPGS